MKRRKDYRTVWVLADVAIEPFGFSLMLTQKTVALYIPNRFELADKNAAKQWQLD